MTDLLAAYETVPLWLRLLVDAAAVWRITRIVVADTFPPIRWVRDKITAANTKTVDVFGMVPPPLPTMLVQDEPGALAYAAKTGEPFVVQGHEAEWQARQPQVRAVVGTRQVPGALAELVNCPHCASVWVAAAVIAAESWAPTGFALVALGAAFSALAGLIVRAEPD